MIMCTVACWFSTNPSGKQKSVLPIFWYTYCDNRTEESAKHRQPQKVNEEASSLWSNFKYNVESGLWLHWFYFNKFSDWSRNSCHHLNQSDLNVQGNETRPFPFARASGSLPDWTFSSHCSVNQLGVLVHIRRPWDDECYVCARAKSSPRVSNRKLQWSRYLKH